MAVQVKTILILGGTGDARALAERLDARGDLEVITSLAGRTRTPALPPGEIRVGGFGGVDGLVDYIELSGIDLVVDATHPFAAGMSRNAFQACAQSETPLLRLERPPWREGEDDQWRMVPDVQKAASALPRGGRALVTVGRQELAPFAARSDVAVIARMIEAPDTRLPENVLVILDRPPFTYADERALMIEQKITVLVCKNSGGVATQAKLTAARDLKIPVLMVARPELPEVQSVTTAEELEALLVRGFNV